MWFVVVPRYAANMCFTSAYMDSIFKDALGWNRSQPITFASSIAGSDASWALGAALFYGGHMGWHLPSPGPTRHARNVVLAVSVTVVVVFAVGFWWVRHRRSQDESEEKALLGSPMLRN